MLSMLTGLLLPLDEQLTSRPRWRGGNDKGAGGVVIAAAIPGVSAASDEVLSSIGATLTFCAGNMLEHDCACGNVGTDFGKTGCSCCGGDAVLLGCACFVGFEDCWVFASVVSCRLYVFFPFAFGWYMWKQLSRYTTFGL
jgi:hypothetical protein